MKSSLQSTGLNLKLRRCKVCGVWAEDRIGDLQEMTFGAITVRWHEINLYCRNCGLHQRPVVNQHSLYYLAVLTACKAKLADPTLNVIVPKKLKEIGKIRNCRHGRPALYWYKLERKVSNYLRLHMAPVVF